MEEHLRKLIQLLADLEPLDEPPGQAGVQYTSGTGTTRICAPVISVYLDMSLSEVGARPEERTGMVVLRDRLRDTARAFWPRGQAHDAVVEDTQRIEQYLSERASPSARGIALFASAQHHLFETLETSEPFKNEVSVRATPSLFQLARLLDDRRTAIVAMVALNVARLFVLRAGQLTEVEHRDDDPKLYHKVRGTAVMNQKHYQRHADLTRAEFAREVAGMVERLAQQEEAVQVIVAGEQEAIALLRHALSPYIREMLTQQSPRLDVRTPRDAITEEVEPLLRQAETDDARTVVEQVLEGVEAGELGVAGVEPTRTALQRGQADILALSSTAEVPDETRSQLIELAERTGARIEIVDEITPLDQLGGVGAVLRYRLGIGA